MKFEEIIPALKAGKKIRLKYWHKDAYMYINSNGKFENHSGYYFPIYLRSLHDIEKDDWEIVE